MQTTSIMNSSKPFEGFKVKAEATLQKLYPRAFDDGRIHGIHIGRNKDSSGGSRGGFKINPGASTMASAIFAQMPSRTMDGKILSNIGNAKAQTFMAKASEKVLQSAADQVRELIGKGIKADEAKSRVTDSLARVGYFDAKSGLFIVERILGKTSGRTTDSILSGLQTPYWDVAQVQKVFKQPFQTGYAQRLVNEIGVPNVWADLVQIFTETFEGFARLSTVARGTGEHNTSIAAKNATGTMLSEVVNLVIDYESQSPNEQMMGGQPGNWLTNALVGDRDRYADLMLTQLHNMLIYFGDAESGFEGLTQIANRDSTYEFYDSSLPPAEYLWLNDTVNPTLGADLLLTFMHMLADKIEALQFLPVNIKVNCAPILYKVLKFSMLSKVYNQNSPLSIISNAFDYGNKIVGTMSTGSVDKVYTTFELAPDAMLSAESPFNATDEDLLFITFPALQSALEDGNLVDLIMAPTLIDRMILPSAPGYRDGTVRTAIKRIGSLLVPVTDVVWVISGMGTNSRYTPPST